MKYLGSKNDYADSHGKTGVLLCNLGTPDRPVCPGLRKYLAEFLMDPRVVEIPKLLRMILVRGIIVNVRSHKSAAAYREIWTDEGSPLLLNSERLGDLVQVIAKLAFQPLGQPSAVEFIAVCGIKNSGDLTHEGFKLVHCLVQLVRNL